MFLPWLLSSDHFLRKTFEGSPRGTNGSARILQLPLNAAPNSTFDVVLACRLAACLVRSACDYGTNVFYNISQQFRAHENIRQWGQKELCWHITVPNCSQLRIVALIWHRQEFYTGVSHVINLRPISYHRLVSSLHPSNPSQLPQHGYVIRAWWEFFEVLGRPKLNWLYSRCCST